jgi:hypothetical protein
MISEAGKASYRLGRTFTASELRDYSKSYRIILESTE